MESAVIGCGGFKGAGRAAGLSGGMFAVDHVNSLAIHDRKAEPPTAFSHEDLFGEQERASFQGSAALEIRSVEGNERSVRRIYGERAGGPRQATT